MDRRLLAVFAHPDDESFSVGGTLAHYASQGVEVSLVSATRGEVGEIADPSLATSEDLATVRERELRCAADVLGVREVAFLGFRDSGMAGTEDNSHPDAFARADEEAVVEVLVGHLRRLRPHVVVTFEPGGGYGHPDHMAIHRRTRAAFHAAGDRTRYTEAGPAWAPSRLFYSALPRSMLLSMRDRLLAAGFDTGFLDQVERSGATWADDQVDVTMDVRDSVERKWSALHCHRTQLPPDNPLLRLPEATAKELMSREFFGLGHPSRDAGPRPADLFDGI